MSYDAGANPGTYLFIRFLIASPVMFLIMIARGYALRLAHITKERFEVPGGGEIERNKETGEPTGVLKECFQALPIHTFTHGQVKEALHLDVAKYWVKQGFTTAYSFAVDAVELRAYQELLNEDSLPLRIQVMFNDAINSADSLESLTQLGVLPGLGNDWLKLGGKYLWTVHSWGSRRLLMTLT